MKNLIAPQGSTTVILTAGQSIAVATDGQSRVYQNVGYPSFPTTQTLLGTVIGGQSGANAGISNGQIVFGPFASGASITIEGGFADTLYEIGTSPVVQFLYTSAVSTTPVAVNVTGAVSAAAILGGLVTSTTAAAVAGTIPTGTAMDAASSFGINDSIDWSVINTGGANAFTVTAATGHTIVGAAAVAASTSGRFRTVKTAANTFITYRLA